LSGAPRRRRCATAARPPRFARACARATVAGDTRNAAAIGFALLRGSCIATTTSASRSAGSRCVNVPTRLPPRYTANCPSATASTQPCGPK
jgi:hypothetical protein